MVNADFCNSPYSRVEPHELHDAAGTIIPHSQAISVKLLLYVTFKV